MKDSNFFADLHRRNVYKVAGVKAMPRMESAR